jgi:hypothetical protein
MHSLYTHYALTIPHIKGSHVCIREQIENDPSITMIDTDLMVTKLGISTRVAREMMRHYTVLTVLTVLTILTILTILTVLTVLTAGEMMRHAVAYLIVEDGAMNPEDLIELLGTVLTVLTVLYSYSTHTLLYCTHAARARKHGQSNH